MRPILTVAMIAALAACGPRDATTLPAAEEVPSRIYIGGAGVFMELESVGTTGGMAAYELPVSRELVWAAMPWAFSEIGLRGAGVMDAGRWAFGYPNAVIPGRLADRRLSSFLGCGQSPGGQNADTHRVTGTIVAAVRPAEEAGKSVVEVRVEAVARPREVSGNTVRCSSNGRLERLIAYTAMQRAIETM